MRVQRKSKRVWGTTSVILAAAAWTGWGARAARADITYTDLYTLGKGTFVSVAGGAYQAAVSGQVVGYGIETITADSEGPYHALAWSAASPNGVDLKPSNGYASTIALGTNGTQQVGYGWGTATNSANHAMVWSGTAASAIDLHPFGFTVSYALSTDGTQQVGYGVGPATDNGLHALLWSGRANSYIDLTPGNSDARAYAISGGQQVGYASVDIGNDRTEGHAMRWSGTAFSAVDLHPTGFTISIAQATDGQRQVGSGRGTATGNKVHALFWSGTAASVVDLNPPVGSGFVTSTARAVSDTYQVGVAKGPLVSDKDHAMLWSGTAASFIDLHALLPATFVTSMANSISGNTIYGTAQDASGNIHAVVWTVPEPAGLSLLMLGGSVLLRRRRVAE